MKNLLFLIATVLFLSLVSCSGSSDPSGEATRELTLRQTLSGSIATPGEVDWYHYRAVEANNILQVNCSSNTIRPDGSQGGMNPEQFLQQWIEGHKTVQQPKSLPQWVDQRSWACQDEVPVGTEYYDRATKISLN